MTTSPPFSNSKKWSLPEFGIITHVNHTTHKKLKPKSKPMLSAPIEQNQDYQAQVKKGYEDGLQRAQAEIERQKQELMGLMQTLKQVSSRYEQNVQVESHALLLKTCSAILGREISINPDLIKELIDKGLSLIESDQSNVKLYVSEKLHALMKKHQLLEANPTITFEVSDRVKAYDFIIDSDKQNLVFNLEALIEQAINGPTNQ